MERNIIYMNTKFFVTSVFCLFMFSSCYNTKVLVGNVKKNDPVVKVNSVTNHHLLYGLIPVGKTTLQNSEYVGQKENYVVKTNQTFLNGFLNWLTFGIYTPSTTTYYLPLNEVSK